MNFRLTILVLLISFQGFAQKVSVYEKCWAIIHPFVAKKAYRITKDVQKDVQKVKKEKILNGVGNGDQLDAFRHTYWMAILTLEIGEKRARKLGVAHEKGNYKHYKKNRKEDGYLPDKISSDMDLFNNDIGILLALGKENSSKKEILELVEKCVIEGKCKIIKIDDANNFLDVNGNIISKEDIKGMWYNNKCLVDSDFLFQL